MPDCWHVCRYCGRRHPPWEQNKACKRKTRYVRVDNTPEVREQICGVLIMHLQEYVPWVERELRRVQDANATLSGILDAFDEARHGHEEKALRTL